MGDNGAAAPDADNTILEACSEAIQTPFAECEEAVETGIAVGTITATPATSGGTATSESIRDVDTGSGIAVGTITATPAHSGGTAISESIGDMDNGAVPPGAGNAIVEACSEVVTILSATDEKVDVETGVAVGTILTT